MKDVLTALFSSRQETKNDAHKSITAKPDKADMQCVDDIVGCTGKLPLYADFLRSNLNNVEAITLDKWLQSGFQYLSQRRLSTFKEVFNRFPKLEFILFGDHEKRPLSGVIVAGKDQSGREYPFTIFKVLGSTVETSQVPLLPCMFKTFRDLAMDLSQEKWDSADKNTLFKRIDALPHNDLLAGLDYWAQQSRSQLELLSSQFLWENILPVSSLEERSEFVTIFNEKIRSILALAPERRQSGIEINIFDSKKRAVIQQFFVSLVVKLLGSDIWNGQCWLSDFAEGRNRLTMFFRPVMPEDFLTLVDYEAGRNNVIVINDLVEKSDFAPDKQSRSSKYIGSMSDLMKDWVALYNNQQHQTGIVK